MSRRIHKFDGIQKCPKKTTDGHLHPDVHPDVHHTKTNVFAWKDGQTFSATFWLNLSIILRRKNFKTSQRENSKEVYSTSTMKGDQELQVIVQQGKELNPTVQDEINSVGNNQTGVPHSNTYKRWLRVIAYTFFVISGQSVAAILGRLYYDNGGKSKWLATVVQLVGFPVLLPYHLLSIKTHATTHTDSKSASPRNRVLVYVVLGVLVGAGCYLYSIGLLYLPVSTFSLICASQLAFNAFFSYFLNSQKLTPIILNSLLLLTISSTLLAFNNEESNFKKVTRGQYVTSFICTIGASAGFGLVLSVKLDELPT
ncbi:hypothetical protein YC2023_095053 [Brassica napus]